MDVHLELAPSRWKWVMDHHLGTQAFGDVLGESPLEESLLIPNLSQAGFLFLFSPFAVFHFSGPTSLTFGSCNNETFR